MAVITENEHGWLICHQTFLNLIYGNCVEGISKLKIRNVFFDINTPLLMNSAAIKRYKSAINVQKLQDVRKRRKNKRPDTGSHHLQAKSVIEEAVLPLCDKGRSLGYLKNLEVSPAEWFDNNGAARLAAKELNCKCYTCYDCQRLTECFMNGRRYFENVEDHSVIKIVGDYQFVIPPHSSCYLADMRNISSMISTKYDVVLLDPPWKNKSIKRKKGYSTMTNDDILHIPIPQLTKPGSLIIIWATNNERQIDFIKKQLFKAWNVEYCVTWYWAKITRKGSLVHPIDSHQKKPYENIIFGQVQSSESSTDPSLSLLGSNKVILSIPSSIHSHKPPLSEILKPYLPQGAKCLELFARYLLPGWTSYGNEVLKLQNLQLFEKAQL